VGGDYYDFLPLSGDRLGLVIADVSDKGIPAALFMSLSRTLVRVNATDRVEPADVLRRTNELLCRETHSDMFLSIFYGVLDWRTGLLRYANAGHNPPLLYRCSQPTVGRTPESGSTAATAGANGGNAEALWLSARGMVLGVTENVEFEERKAAIAPGDLLVLYTDGVTEPIDPDGQAFGEARLEQAIAATWQRSCGDILRHVRQVVVDFAGDQPQFDDYTLVCVKRESTPSAR
jgi:sigma-B regulation protein RsbU (phosphoserine phosphatase)